MPATSKGKGCIRVPGYFSVPLMPASFALPALWCWDRGCAALGRAHPRPPAPSGGCGLRTAGPARGPHRTAFSAAVPGARHGCAQPPANTVNLSGSGFICAPLCTDQREEFLINFPRPAPGMKAGGFRAPSDRGKGSAEPAGAQLLPVLPDRITPRSPRARPRPPSRSRRRPRPDPRPAGPRAPPVAPAAPRLAGAAGGSQWARRSAAGAVPGAERPSPIRAGSAGARAVAAGRPGRLRAVRPRRCRRCSSPADVDSVGQSRLSASPLVCVTDHTASREYVAVVRLRCAEGKWRLPGLTTDGQPAAERSAGLEERRPQLAPCRLRRSASRGAAGVLRPAWGSHRQGAPVRSRPSPEPALVSAAGAAPSCAELSDGAAGSGERGKPWGAQGVPLPGKGAAAPPPCRLGAPGGANGAPRSPVWVRGSRCWSSAVACQCVATGPFQAASALALIPSEASASGRSPAPSGDPVELGTSVCHPGGVFRAVRFNWGVLPALTPAATDLAEVCACAFLS